MNDLRLLLLACINHSPDILLQGDSSRNLQLQFIMDKSSADMDLTKGCLKKQVSVLGSIEGVK